MLEAQVDLSLLRCPRCAGELVLRIGGEERPGEVHLRLDTACAACGVSPWPDSDERLVVYRPGASIGGQVAGAAADYAVELSLAQQRVDLLSQRVRDLERDLASARRSVDRASALERQRKEELERDLRGEISRLEGALADARSEVRRAEEATRGLVRPGLRPIEID